MRPGERGAATLLVVALAGLLLFIGVAVVGVTAVVVAHREAQSAADLAALAGARAWAEGDDGCVTASEIAQANRSVLTECHVLGRDVTVTVSRSTRPGFGLVLDLTARARAGPA